ncbi:hypothetical protein Tco_0809581 [Tanacetum coccineum]
MFLAKNGKLRIRAKCLGKIHVITLDGEGPSNTKEAASKKKTTKVKGKKDVGPSDPVWPNKKGVSLCGKGRPKPLVVDECPWALQISKVKNTKTWEVKTYTNEHKCLQSTEIHACTSKFLSKGIVEQIEKNPDIPIRALQDELQKKYELELRRANPGTRIKIKVERDSDNDLQTRVTMLTSVGLDGNNGIYPLVYAIVEKETTCSWTWFLECLGDDLGMTRESNFTFISDKQEGITIAMTNVSPCTKHRSHFSGRAKSDILLNNLCECFNGQILDARDAPIITTLEYIREYLMRRMVNVIAMINKIDRPLTPSTTKLLKVAMDKANKYTVGFNEGKSMRSTNVAADTRKRPSDAGNAPANKKQSTTSSNAAQKQKKNGKRSI